MTSTTSDEVRQANRAISAAIAPTWERRRAEIEEVSAPVQEWLVRALASEPGDTVLELAAGAGDTGFEVARAVGPGGKLISTDLTEAMVDVARRRGAERGVENVEFRVVDAEQIDLGTDSVDGVVCRYGYMLVPDRTAAFRETRRVLRAGGRLAFAVWGAPQQNPFFIAAPVLAELGHLPPLDPDGAGVFSMASEAAITELLVTAGFEMVQIEGVPVTFRVADIDGYLDLVADTAGPIGLAIQHLAGADRDAVRSACTVTLERFAGAGGLDIPGLALCVLAR